MVELFANVNNVKICYEIHGQGFPLVLLHGFAMYKEFWIAQVKLLSKNFKVITLDNRGCGNSEHPTEPYNMEILADDLKALLEHLNIEEVHIAGHSLGGMYAQHFALKYPKNLNKLLLLATFPNLPLDKSGLEMYKKSQLESYEEKLVDPEKAFYNKMKQRFSRGFYKEMVENPNKRFHDLFTTEELMNLEKINGTSKPLDILNQIEVIVRHDTRNQLHEIKQDTLIMAGDKDRIVSKIASEEMNKLIPSSSLKIFKGGHYFPLENAPAVNNTVNDFLLRK